MGLKSAPTERRAATVWPENPHVGKSGVPFMNSTTGLELSSDLILSTTSIDIPHLRSRPARRAFNSSIKSHCSVALMANQRPISAPVRKHPAQNPWESSVQTFVHGEGGPARPFRSGLVISKEIVLGSAGWEFNALRYIACPFSLKT